MVNSNGTLTQRPKAAARRNQKVTDIVRAEMFRVTRRGGMRVGLIVAAGLGIAAGAVTLIVFRFVAAESSHVLVTSPLEASIFVAALFMALTVAGLAGRDSAGQVGIGLALVPRRQRLYGGSATASVLCGACVVIASSAVITVVALWIANDWSLTGLALLGVLCGALASASLALLAYGAGMLVRSSPVAIFSLLGILVGLPLAAGAAGAFVPAIAPIADLIAAVTPGQLLLDAIAVTTVPSQGVSSVVLAQLGLGIWGLAVSTVGVLVFMRRDARSI